MTDRDTKCHIEVPHSIALMVVAACLLSGCKLAVGDDTGGPNEKDHVSSQAGLDPNASADDGGVPDAKQPLDEADSGDPAAANAMPNAPPANDPTTKDPSPNAVPSNSPAPSNASPSSASPSSVSPSVSPTDPLACAAAPQAALAALTTYCSACHADASNAKGGFSTILDAAALLASGKVVKNQPDMSLIWKRMSAGSMPPANVPKRPAASDIAAVKDWISCGAEDWKGAAAQAPAFVSIDSRLHALLDDLRTITNPVDRERVRYIDLSSLSNAGHSAQQLQVDREALWFLLNSLSHARSVVVPRPIDADKLIYRIDLRDYLWDASNWTQLEASYPYAVVYDHDSRLFPFDEATAQQLRDETKTLIPWIQADWFLSHASRPPLYVSLLKLPGTLAGLEQQFGVDLQRDIESEQVLRSGFAEAGPSQNNGVIERHDLGGNRGAVWLSYDFKNNLDFRNVFAHPRDFQADTRELIFNLENGLQGYFIADAAGQRLDKAPNNVLQDPGSRDGAVETGLSCMNCHQTDGALPKYDEIRDVELKASANAAEIEKVLALYVTHDELEAAFVSDQSRYRTARTALGISSLSNSSIHELDAEHLGIIDLAGVAGVIGLTADDLRRAIEASRQALPPQIVALLNKDGGIQRDAFDAVVGDFIKALGLGEQLLVASSGARRGTADTATNTNGIHY